MAPIAAIFIVAIAHFAFVFTAAVRDVAEAEARAGMAARAWDESHDGNGFKRPCIEEIEEVSLAAIPICVP